jgi:hypothetical protein
MLLVIQVLYGNLIPSRQQKTHGTDRQHYSPWRNLNQVDVPVPRLREIEVETVLLTEHRQPAGLEKQQRHNPINTSTVQGPIPAANSRGGVDRPVQIVTQRYKSTPMESFIVRNTGIIIYCLLSIVQRVLLGIVQRRVQIRVR